MLPDENGQLAIIAARIIERTAQIESLDWALSIDKAELKTLATSFYFTQASGKVDVASSVSVRCASGEVLITFPNRYELIVIDVEPIGLAGLNATFREFWLPRQQQPFFGENFAEIWVDFRPEF